MKKSRIVLIVIFSFFIAVFSFCGGWYFVATKDAYLDEKKLALSSDKIEVFDKNDQPAESVAAYFPSSVFRLSTLPNKVKFAFVDTEDKRFYSHDGFDFRRIVKAVWTNLKSRSFRQGASTISQQLIKNTHLTQEKTIKRKLQEFKLTRQLEKKYSKDAILEKYLNTIYFGHNCFGLQAAANFYFGKEPHELTLSDGAILAGLIRSPNNYSPFKNPENCKKRKTIVLNAMLAQKHITVKEKQEAEREPLPVSSAKCTADKSYFARVFDELETLSETKGIPLVGNVKIYTFLDANLQKELAELESIANTDKIFAVLDHKKAGFAAYYSTVGAPKRLPGSLIKPLLVYAPALEEGVISPATQILDEKTDFSGYKPSNYGNQYYGYISARECLSKSLNVPAVKILASTGVKKSAEYLKKTGLSVPQKDLSLALALGGMQEGFSLTELMSAYAAFPQGGFFQETGFIRKIVVGGRTVYRKPEKKNKAFSEETAYLTTDMLQTAVKSGTAKKLGSLPFSIAAKTGTCGRKEGNTDAYTVSYTSDYTVGVWFGNADNTLTDITGGGVCCNASYAINAHLAKIRTPAPFKSPNGVVKMQLDGLEYKSTHRIILADENAPPSFRFSEIFNQKFAPSVRSETFSKPFISTPKLNFEKGVVSIQTSALPPYYSYRIDRYDYDTHTTVFDGTVDGDFTDLPPKSGKKYSYTITPYFKEFIGMSVTLPDITTDETLSPVQPTEPPEITKKDWWDY